MLLCLTNRNYITSGAVCKHQQLPAPTVYYMYCTGGTEMPQLHTRQPLSMCCQNSIRGQPENSLHQERTHAEWFSQCKCLELLIASRWNKEIFRCYEAKIEESEKAVSCRESNPGHLACAASALPLSYDNRTTTGPPQSSICTAQVGLKCLSCTPGSHSRVTMSSYNNLLRRCKLDHTAWWPSEAPHWLNG